MLDVKVLYINIPKHEEIEAVKNVLNLILTLFCNLYSMKFTICKKYDILWEQYVLRTTIKFSWENLKKYTFIHT